MKNILFGLILVLTVSIAALAQKNKTQHDVVKPGGGAGKTQKTNKSQVDKPLLQSMTNIEAQLQSMVDVRKSQVGDEIVLKTTKSVKQNGETVIPKGSSLIGRITEVQQKSKDNGGSKIGMVFGRLEGKSLATPIMASIVSITNARAANSVGDVFASDISGSSSSSTRASSGGGGGLLGGVGNTVGGVVNTATQTVGAATNTVGQTVGTATGTAGQTINGLQISQSASGSANGSTTLSSRDKNIRLEKGLTFNMNIAAAAQR